MDMDRAAGDGGRNGAGSIPASCPSPLPQVEADSDSDYIEAESQTEAEKPASHPVSKAPKKITKLEEDIQPRRKPSVLAVLQACKPAITKV